MQTSIIILLFTIHASQAEREPLPPSRVWRPFFIERGTPKSAVQMWMESESDPSTLLKYIVPQSAWPKERIVDPHSRPFREEAVLRHFAIERFGDVANLRLILLLEEKIKLLEQEREREVAEQCRLAIERIRLREQMPEKYIPTMLEWLKTEPPRKGTPEELDRYSQKVRAGARALGIARATEAVPALVEKYRRTHSFAILRALARMEDPRALPVLREAAGSSPQFGSPTEPGEAWPYFTYWELRLKGLSLTQRIETLVKALREEGPTTHAENMLYIEGSLVAPALVRILSEAPSGKYGSGARIYAAQTLGRLQAKSSIKILAKIMLESKEPTNLRDVCAAALREMEDPSVVPFLVEAAKDANTSVRLAALYSLWDIGDPRAENVAIENLRTPDPNVRWRAAEVLFRIGSRTGLVALEEAVNTERNVDVRGNMEGLIRTLRSKLK